MDSKHSSSRRVRSWRAILAAFTFLAGSSLFLIVLMRPVLNPTWAACVVVTLWTVSLGTYLWVVTGRPPPPESVLVEISSDEAFRKYADRYIATTFGPHWRALSGVVAVLTTSAAVVFGFQLFDAPKRIEDINRSTTALTEGVRQSFELIPDTVDMLTTKIQDLQQALRAESLRSGTVDIRMNERPRIWQTMTELGFYRTAMLDRQSKALRRYVKEPSARFQQQRAEFERLTRELLNPKEECTEQENTAAPVEADLVALDAGLEPEEASAQQLSCLAGRLKHAADAFATKDYRGFEDYPDATAPKNVLAYRNFMSAKLHRDAAQIATRLALRCATDEHERSCALLDDVKATAERLPVLIPAGTRPDYRLTRSKGGSPDPLAIGDALCLNEIGLSDAHLKAIDCDGKIFQAYNAHLLGWWKWKIGDYDQARKFLLAAQQSTTESQKCAKHYVNDVSARPMVFAAARNTLAWAYLEGLDKPQSRLGEDKAYQAVLYSSEAIDETGETISDKRFDRLETYVRALQRSGMLYQAVMQLYKGFILAADYKKHGAPSPWQKKYCDRFLKSVDEQVHPPLLDEADDHYAQYLNDASSGPRDPMIHFKVARLLQVRASVSWICAKAESRAARQKKSLWGGEDNTDDDDGDSPNPEVAKATGQRFCAAQPHLDAALLGSTSSALARVAIDYGNGWLSMCEAELNDAQTQKKVSLCAPQRPVQLPGHDEAGFFVSTLDERHLPSLFAHFPTPDVDVRIVLNRILGALKGELSNAQAFELAEMAIDAFADSRFKPRYAATVADVALRSHGSRTHLELGTALLLAQSCGERDRDFKKILQRHQALIPDTLLKAVECDQGYRKE